MKKQALLVAMMRPELASLEETNYASVVRALRKLAQRGLRWNAVVWVSVPSRAVLASTRVDEQESLHALLHVVEEAAAMPVNAAFRKAVNDADAQALVHATVW